METVPATADKIKEVVSSLGLTIPSEAQIKEYSPDQMSNFIESINVSINKASTEVARNEVKIQNLDSEIKTLQDQLKSSFGVSTEDEIQGLIDKTNQEISQQVSSLQELIA